MFRPMRALGLGKGGGRHIISARAASGGRAPLVDLTSLFSSTDAPPAPPGSRSDVAGQSFDLVVIGGGSGGIAAATEAAGRGASVALLDFVSPSAQGTRWGLGGTCVNVGCIPKKIFHRAADLGRAAGREAAAFGWEPRRALSRTSPALVPHHSWDTLVSRAQDHILSLNFGYRSQLLSLGVTYINALGEVGRAVGDDGTRAVRVVWKEDQESGRGECEILARNTLVSVGGRPHMPEVGSIAGLEPEMLSPGGAVISSDDIFTLGRAPGRTLVVGAGYVALECAGFIAGLQNEDDPGGVTVLARSSLLRGFDRQMVGYVARGLRREGVRIIQDHVVASMSPAGNDGSAAVSVSWEPTGGGGSGGGGGAAFDTILFAIGRDAVAGRALGPELTQRAARATALATAHDDKRGGTAAATMEQRQQRRGRSAQHQAAAAVPAPAITKVVVNSEGQILVADEAGGEGEGAHEEGVDRRCGHMKPLRSVFAVGDCVEGREELTPVAIAAGRGIARRLFPNSNGDDREGAEGGTRPLPRPLDLEAVATCIYTPTEYACFGLSEEEARARYDPSGNARNSGGGHGGSRATAELEVYHAAWDTAETALTDMFSKGSNADAERQPVAGRSGGAEDGHKVAGDDAGGGAAGETAGDAEIYPQACYAKAVCVREGGSSAYHVVGLHLAGPMAGEVIQGFAVAHTSHRRLGEDRVGDRHWTGGLPKSALDDCIGIHPTLAEGLVQGALSARKSRGESPERTSC